MAQIGPQEKRDRIAATIAAVAIQALIFLALVDGLGFRAADRPQEAMKLLDLAEDVPPPPTVTAPVPQKHEASPLPQGEAASPIVAPRPAVPVPAPPSIAASPAPADGLAASAGTGDAGLGAGQGGGGTGSGDGGIAVRAQRIQGALLDRDYPRSARRAGAEGVVFVRFTVEPDGEVSKCIVTRSSGHEDLDALTCRLIERRFRYRPARDAQGRPVAEVMNLTYEWGLRR